MSFEPADNIKITGKKNKGNGIYIFNVDVDDQDRKHKVIVKVRGKPLNCTTVIINLNLNIITYANFDNFSLYDQKITDCFRAYIDVKNYEGHPIYKTSNIIDLYVYVSKDGVSFVKESDDSKIYFNNNFSRSEFKIADRHTNSKLREWNKGQGEQTYYLRVQSDVGDACGPRMKIRCNLGITY